MRVYLLSIFMLLAYSLKSYTQVDIRPVVGVTHFTCETDGKYAGLVAEKVVEVLTNSKRFQVVDRTSYDQVQAELELQKSESFIDSKNTVNQGGAVAAQSLITGHITKIPVYSMRNTTGTISGYKASVAFQIKIVDVETGVSTEATSFQGKASDLMLSPESAVTSAMISLQTELESYFTKNFPIKCKIQKILSSRKDAADVVLIDAGLLQGLHENDRLTVESIEILDNKPYPVLISEIKIIKLAGENFAECKVQKKGASQLLNRFNAGEKLECKLIIKK